MGQTNQPHGMRGRGLGFEVGVIESLVHELRDAVPQISEAWIIPRAPERGAELWIAVRGLDEKAESLRRLVRERLVEFVNMHRENIRAERFVFDYHVFADDVDMRIPSVPDDARAV